MAVTYLSRAQWGAGSLGSGRRVSHAQFVGLVVHHTVAVMPDYDRDGRRYGDIDDIKRYMRWLQHARPDLGNDVPYSFVVFEGAQQGDCVVAEGRGFGVTGAHTAGYNCVAPEHRVLTDDLRWVPAGDLVAGDSLLAFDESVPGGQGHARDLRYAEVTSNVVEPADAYLVVLDDGNEIVTTAEHPWLVRSQGNVHWVTTRRLRWSGVHSHVYKCFEPWSTDLSRDGGWLAGFLDGEGTIAFNRRTPRGAGQRVMFSQNPGPIFDSAVALIEAKGFRVSVAGAQPTRRTWQATILGGGGEMIRFLGTIRPGRLISNLYKQTLPSMRALSTTRTKVLRVVPLGKREISRLSTSSRTYFAEGFAMHNSTRYGVALAGNSSTRPVTEGILSGYRWVGRRLADPAGAVRTIGHRDVKATECPGNSLYAALPQIQPPFEEEDMPLTDADLRNIRAAVRTVLNEGTGRGQPNWAETSQATLAQVQRNTVLINSLRSSLDAAGIDEAELAAALAPLLAANTNSLSDADLEAVAKAVNDEQGRRATT